MTGKLIANLTAILLFINAVAASATDVFTSLAVTYPAFSKYVVISMAVCAFITPFLPRIQKIGQTVDEAQRKS